MTSPFAELRHYVLAACLFLFLVAWSAFALLGLLVLVGIVR
jgi:hypothetical protein